MGAGGKIFSVEVSYDHALRMVIYFCLTSTFFLGGFSMIFLGMHTDVVKANYVVPMSTFVFSLAGLFFAMLFDTFAISKVEILRRRGWHRDAMKGLQAELEAVHEKSIQKIRERMQDHHIVSRAAAMYRREIIAHPFAKQDLLEKPDNQHTNVTETKDALAVAGSKVVPVAEEGQGGEEEEGNRSSRSRGRK